MGLQQRKTATRKKETGEAKDSGCAPNKREVLKYTKLGEQYWDAWEGRMGIAESWLMGLLGECSFIIIPFIKVNWKHFY